MPELMLTLRGIYEREHRKNKFMAAIQGVDIDKPAEKTAEESETSIEDVYSRVASRLGADKNQSEAIRQGFTPEMGIAYEVIEQ